MVADWTPSLENWWERGWRKISKYPVPPVGDAMGYDLLGLRNGPCLGDTFVALVS